MRGFDDLGSVYMTKPPSMAAGPRMMLPAQSQRMFENPTYNVSGKSGQQRVSSSAEHIYQHDGKRGA